MTSDLSPVFYTKDGDRFVPVESGEWVSAQQNGVWLTIVRDGRTKHFRLNEEESSLDLDISSVIRQKLLEEDVTTLVKDACDDVLVETPTGNLTLIPLVWYRRIAQRLLETCSKERKEEGLNLDE